MKRRDDLIHIRNLQKKELLNLLKEKKKELFLLKTSSVFGTEEKNVKIRKIIKKYISRVCTEISVRKKTE